MRKKSIHEVKPCVDKRVEKAIKKAKASRVIQDQIRELLVIEPFDYLKCIELCIKFGKQKHHIDDSKDDLLGLAKYESCIG